MGTLSEKYSQDCIVRGEPFLSRCIAYREQYEKNAEIIQQYVESIGGESFASFRGHRGFGVKFKYSEGNLSRDRHELWSAPNKAGYCYPKRTKAAAELREKVNSFEPLPSTYPVYDDIPLDMEYSRVNENGSTTATGRTMLIRRVDPEISWVFVDDEVLYFMHLPKYDVYIAEKREEDVLYNPGETTIIDKNVLNFKMPDALQPIGPKMYDYLFAKGRMQEEQQQIEAAAKDYAS